MARATGSAWSASTAAARPSLLQVLADEPGALAVDGEVVRGKTVRLGYLTQEPVPVDPNLRVLEAAEQVRGTVAIGKRELSASQLLDRLGLRADRQWTPVRRIVWW